ncbi:MAG: hypothetical protein NC355_05965 [Blautia sp.]|nr:hypothetical protein [Blautia sp.]MCM1284127.1 hypothetical protein [Roseburia sp.]MCM1431937.1 hypothetical protein [Muribaculaceae bacterium]MCM1493543.1 hypothetical protein [Muribaculaceae bacterium]
MKEVIREYGSAVIAAVGAFLLFAIVGQMVFCPDGMLGQMVQLWGNGGC